MFSLRADVIEAARQRRRCYFRYASAVALMSTPDALIISPPILRH